MLNIQFDIKRIHIFKELLFRLRHNGSSETIQANLNEYFQNVNAVDILFIQLELINGDYGITSEDVKNFSRIYHQLSDKTINKKELYPADHPVSIFKEENTAFQVVLNQMNHLLELLKEDSDQSQKLDTINELKQLIFRLGEFHNHYHRKEKLFFPILERYGYYAPVRTVWKVDDQIRVLYQAVKNEAFNWRMRILHTF